jgi:hypothetical protein
MSLRSWTGLGLFIGLMSGCSGTTLGPSGNHGGAGGAAMSGSGGLVFGSGGGARSGSGGASGAGGGFVFAAGGASGGSGGLLFGTGGGAAQLPDSGASCFGTVVINDPIPVDMYIMFDQSTSMSDPLPDNSSSWWSAGQAAVTNFVNNARATGMGVGLQYFGLPHSVPGCTSFSTLAGDCCDPSVYAKPEVEIGLLPGNAAALTASIQAHNPVSFTPTLPALKGAIDHMKAWAQTHSGRAPVVVFVTDGFPTTCASTTDVDNGAPISDVALLAKTAFETDPKVRTFVVGFNSGQGLGNLDQIAKAGGTGQAFLIAGGNISDTFTNAMLSTGASPLGCSFNLPQPSGAPFDVNKVDLSYTTGATGVSEPIAKLNNLGDCSLNQNQGWYYDSPAAPTKILLCPGTCSRLSAGRIEVLYGCTPRLPGL